MNDDRRGVSSGPGRRLAIDVGGARIGVALSDPAPVLATPLVTLTRDRYHDSSLDELADLVAEHEVVEVIVGMPKTLSGQHGGAASAAREYGDALAERIAPIPVRYADERLTTVTASRMLTQRGIRGRKQRAVVDQAAAVEILQAWLDGRGQTT